MYIDPLYVCPAESPVASTAIVTKAPSQPVTLSQSPPSFLDAEHLLGISPEQVAEISFSCF